MGLVETLVDEYEGKERELLNLMARKYGDVSILSYDPLIDDDLAPGSTSGMSCVYYTLVGNSERHTSVNL